MSGGFLQSLMKGRVVYLGIVFHCTGAFLESPRGSGGTFFFGVFVYCEAKHDWEKRVSEYITWCLQGGMFGELFTTKLLVKVCQIRNARVQSSAS